MERLEYKGYFGNIEYSKEDKCIYGKVLGSEIHSRIASYAENHGTSINAFIRDSIERRLEMPH